MRRMLVVLAGVAVLQAGCSSTREYRAEPQAYARAEAEAAAGEKAIVPVEAEGGRRTAVRFDSIRYVEDSLDERLHRLHVEDQRAQLRGASLVALGTSLGIGTAILVLGGSGNDDAWDGSARLGYAVGAVVVGALVAIPLAAVGEAKGGPEVGD